VRSAASLKNIKKKYVWILIDVWKVRLKIIIVSYCNMDKLCAKCGILMLPEQRSSTDPSRSCIYCNNTDSELEKPALTIKYQTPHQLLQAACDEFGKNCLWERKKRIPLMRFAKELENSVFAKELPPLPAKPPTPSVPNPVSPISGSGVVYLQTGL